MMRSVEHQRLRQALSDLKSDPTELAGGTRIIIMGFSGKIAAFLKDRSRKPSYDEDRLTATD
jgi:hypothetical protein